MALDPPRSAHSKLAISQSETEGITVCRLRGAINAGSPSNELRTYLNGLADQGKTKVVLNLEGVDAIDSSGLGTLILGHLMMQKAGGAVKLTNLSKRNIQLLILTKLTTVFELFTDESDAVNSFFPNRKISRFDVLQFVQEK